MEIRKMHCVVFKKDIQKMLDNMTNNVEIMFFKKRKILNLSTRDKSIILDWIEKDEK